MTGLACSCPSSSDAPGLRVAGVGCLRKVQSSRACPCGRPSYDDARGETAQRQSSTQPPLAQLAFPVNRNSTGAVLQLADVAPRIPVSRLTDGVCGHTVTK